MTEGTAPQGGAASGFPSVMAAEIADQPHAVDATLDALLPLRPAIRELAGPRRHVVFVARGSSDNAAIYGRYLLEARAGRQASLAAPSIATHYRATLDLRDAIVVSVSQSGRTEEIVETQAWAAACGAATIAVTNVETSPLAADSDLALVTRAGTERAVPATKSYTSQLAAMAVLGSALAPQPEAIVGPLRDVPAAIDRLLERRSGIDEAVERLMPATDVMVSGRGLVYGTALEVALKLEETCLRPVRGLSYADLRHGPMAVVDADVVAVLISATDGPLVDGMTALAADLRDKDAFALAIGGDQGLAGACDHAVAGPDLPEVVAPLGLIVPAQMIVEALARSLGLDPDAPRGLSKVTQTDRSPE